jgi:hypothetical protein
MSIVMSMYQKPQICADLTRGTSSINKNSSDRHLFASTTKKRIDKTSATSLTMHMLLQLKSAVAEGDPREYNLDP